MSHTVAFIQARMSSSRLPGKVLLPLAGRPLVAYMAERARRATTLDAVVIVTSTDPSDDALARAARAEGLPCFRGDLTDVLRRYADATRAHDATTVVRLTGDCPLIDPAVIDAVVHALQTRGVDYASNVDPPSFPDGLDVECFTRAALERADAEARRGPEREHVTLWMRDAASGLTRANVRAPADLSALRLTVDYPDDLPVVRTIVDALESHPACAGRTFDLYDILRVLGERPEIFATNSHARNEGLTKSLAEEALARS